MLNNETEKLELYKNRLIRNIHINEGAFHVNYFAIQWLDEISHTR